MGMPEARGTLGKDPSQERAVVLLSTSEEDSNETGVEATELGSSYVLRLVKKCTLLECGGVDGELGMGIHCCIGENTAFISMLWFFQSLMGWKAAASSGMGDMLAPSWSSWTSLAWNLNS